MMPIGPPQICLAAGPTDLRMSFEGRSDLVRNQFGQDSLKKGVSMTNG